jgi:hypothetical protein
MHFAKIKCLSESAQDDPNPTDGELWTTAKH